MPQQCMPQTCYTYQQPSGYQQYACYNAPFDPGYPVPRPAVYPPINYQAAPCYMPARNALTDTPWVGRTRAQVEEDNLKIAERENVYKYNAMKPVGAAPDQLFWVLEIDGATTLRDFRTIDQDLGPGKWERDPRYNNAYFVREEPKKVEKKDEKKDEKK